jgi:hypothetical protein
MENITTEAKKEDHAKDQAGAQLNSIREMVATLAIAEACEEENPRGCAHDEQEAHDDTEKCREAITEDALEVCIRSDWHGVGNADNAATDYLILLCTGGPAVRMIGGLDKYAQPETARIEYQDWGTPWTDYPMTSEEEADCIKYAQQFYFEE